MFTDSKTVRKVPDEIDFSDDDVQRIRAVLPEDSDPERMKLLPDILWYAGTHHFLWDLDPELALWDLDPELALWDLDPEFERNLNPQERRELKEISKLASELAGLLDTLQYRARKKLRREFVDQFRHKIGGRADDKLTESTKRYDAGIDFLSALKAASARCSAATGKGHPRNMISFRVLSHLAEIFECVTRGEAKRQVDRITGEECGAFYDFAAEVWPVLFQQGRNGLSAAMRNWKGMRDKHGTRRDLIPMFSFELGLWGSPPISFPRG